MENSKQDWTLSGIATSLQFFPKILFLVFDAILPTRQNGVEYPDKAYFTGRLMNFVKNRNRHSGLKNFKIITAAFIVESLGFISFALTIAW